MIHSLFRKALKNLKNNYSISFMIAFIITHKSTKSRILVAYLLKVNCSQPRTQLLLAREVLLF